MMQLIVMLCSLSDFWHWDAEEERTLSAIGALNRHFLGVNVRLVDLYSKGALKCAFLFKGGA